MPNIIYNIPSKPIKNMEVKTYSYSIFSFEGKLVRRITCYKMTVDNNGQKIFYDGQHSSPIAVIPKEWAVVEDRKEQLDFGEQEKLLKNIQNY